MKASRILSAVNISSVRLETVVKQFQIPWSFLTPRHPQHTKNVHAKEIYTDTDRKLYKPLVAQMMINTWSGMSSNFVLTAVQC
jgi:hypothetical protein